MQLQIACGGSDSTPPTSAPITTPAPTASNLAGASQSRPTMQAFPVPSGSRPHDVAPAVDGGVWYAAQVRANWVGLIPTPEKPNTHHWAVARGLMV